MMLPKRITEALVGYGSNEPLVANHEIRRGDIRKVKASNKEGFESRLVLVVAVDQRYEFSEVLLIHTYREQATSADAVFFPNEVGTHYPIVVETDIRGFVRTVQIGVAVAKLSNDEMDVINAVIAGDGEAVSLDKSGMQISGPADPRWEFKLGEIEALNRLSDNCTSVLLGGEPLWQVDPGLIELLNSKSVHDTESMVYELMGILRTQKVVLTLNDLEVLEGRGLLEIDVWVQTFGKSTGRDLFMSFQSLIDSALSSIDNLDEEGPAEWSPTRQLARAPGICEIQLGVHKRLITSEFLWDGDPKKLKLVAKEPNLGTTQAIEVMLVGATTQGGHE
jgi:hypothetical protein